MKTMSSPTTRTKYTTPVNNRLQKLSVDTAVYQATKLKADKQKLPIYKEIYLLATREKVERKDLVEATGYKKQFIHKIIKDLEGGER